MPSTAPQEAKPFRAEGRMITGDHTKTGRVYVTYDGDVYYAPFGCRLPESDEEAEFLCRKIGSGGKLDNPEL